MLWLYDRIGEGWLLELGRLLLTQTLDREEVLLDPLPSVPVATFDTRYSGRQYRLLERRGNM